MKLRNRILIQTLSASLAFILLFGLMFFLSVAEIRKNVLLNSGRLGDRAAEISAWALEEQVTENIARVASDMVLILDEKLLKIENHTRMTADIAGTIYTYREAYRPHRLPLAKPGDMSPAGPYVHTAPGVVHSRIRAETDLAGNIGDLLRQITVVDRGITTSTIGGESGYIIAMDAAPWPLEDYDPRTHDWYRGAKERGDLYWTGIYADFRGRGATISCAMPFYDQSGEGRVFQGVARSTVILSDFARTIDAAKVGRTGYIFILDQSGMRIFSAGSVTVRAGADGGIRGENFLEGGDPRLRSLGLSMTLGASGMTELDMDGMRAYVAYAPVRTLGWSLGVAIPVQDVISPAWLIGEQILALTGEAQDGMDRRIILLAGIIGAALLAALAGIAFLSVRFTGAITRPILVLNEGVREVSGGNLDREVVVSTGDEIEQLARSFNTMTGHLRERIAEISRVSAERERIATELDVATKIQISMLPRRFPPFPGRDNDFDLYAVVHPAREVGGDFYDFFFIDGAHFAVIVADVSGKGIPAALFMAITKTLIRNQLQTGEEPGRVMERINRQLCRNNIADMFVTLWLGVLETETGTLRYINAGHTPPLLKTRRRGFVFLTSPPDLFLAGTDDTVYHCRETRLEDGDTLFLYTDGITEAVDGEERFYGRERLRQFLDRQDELPPRELLPAIREDIGRFAGGAEQSDDITMLALRMTRGTAPRAIVLGADVGSLEMLTAFVGRELERAACPEKIRGQIELAAEEIFVNIARYAYLNSGTAFLPEEPPGEVTIRSEIGRVPGGTVMTLRFADQGNPFNPLDQAEPDITLPLEERPVGGLGLLMVRRTMDSIDYRYQDGTNHLALVKSWQDGT